MRGGELGQPSIWRGFWLGAATSLVVTALSFAGQAIAGLPSIPYVVFEWTTRLLPGPLVNFAVERMVDLVTVLDVSSTATAAKAAEKGLAVGGFVMAGALYGALLAAFGRRMPRRLLVIALSGSVAFGVAVAAMLASLGVRASPWPAALVWIGALFIGWGAVLARALAPGGASNVDRFRRSWLAVLLGSTAAGAVGLVWGRLRRRPTVQLAGGSEVRVVRGTSGPAASPPEEVLDSRFPPVAHTRPELTPNADFYRIDINLRAPEVDGHAWRLQVAGLVRTTLSLSLEDLRAAPAVTQAVTMSCISNRVGGDLIGTGLWTGVRLKEILRRAGAQASAGAVFIQAVDGFHESVVMSDAMDDRTLLVYAMNGVPLTAEHGFPLRIYLPGRYGMKQPKWIRRLELVERWRPGYWVERGWSREAMVQATSVIDTVATSMMLGQAKVLAVGGIAFAGARGISKVEVSVDDGPWSPAELRAPPLGSLTWVQWRYAWPYQPGKHRFRVRAFDGKGVLQSTEARSPHPDGATGIHEMTTVV
jgi:DMSO/TMAO reductase YedYZ molybdopterin-dependent catalytic subunit